MIEKRVLCTFFVVLKRLLKKTLRTDISKANLTMYYIIKKKLSEDFDNSQTFVSCFQMPVALTT